MVRALPCFSKGQAKQPSIVVFVKKKLFLLFVCLFFQKQVQTKNTEISIYVVLGINRNFGQGLIL